jgi:hypothetical protein
MQRLAALSIAPGCHLRVEHAAFSPLVRRAIANRFGLP